MKGQALMKHSLHGKTMLEEITDESMGGPFLLLHNFTSIFHGVNIPIYK